MKFSIGDKVVFKHTDGEGVVSAFINKDMVEVEMEGVAFPVHIDEIDHPYLKWFTEKKKQPVKKIIPEQLPVEKEKARRPRLAKGAYLSFIPVYKTEEMEDVVETLKVYLLNELPWTVQYRYEVTLRDGVLFKHEGRLHEFGHVHLHNIPYDSMNDQPRFGWALDNMDDAHMAPAGGTLRIKPQKLFMHIDDCLGNNKPSFEYTLIDDFAPVGAQREKVKTGNIKVEEMPELPTAKPGAKGKNVADPVATVIDLHIENLVDDTRGMTNADIIMIQLGVLKEHIRLATKARMERLMIVHGLGTGKLKTEVHKVLEETFEVRTYSNEWQAAYGFGATEVWFEY